MRYSRYTLEQVCSKRRQLEAKGEVRGINEGIRDGKSARDMRLKVVQTKDGKSTRGDFAKNTEEPYGTETIPNGGKTRVL
jgi:hypothetical protein